MDIFFAIIVGAILALIVVYLGGLLLGLALFMTDPESLETYDDERK
jgi:branched-subunit amino acid ABC-type transport system permease component